MRISICRAGVVVLGSSVACIARPSIRPWRRSGLVADVDPGPRLSVWPERFEGLATQGVHSGMCLVPQRPQVLVDARALVAWSTGTTLLGLGVLAVGDLERTEALLNVAALWTLILAIDFLISFSDAIWPRQPSKT